MLERKRDDVPVRLRPDAETLGPVQTHHVCLGPFDTGLTRETEQPNRLLCRNDDVRLPAATSGRAKRPATRQQGVSVQSPASEVETEADLSARG